jgi:hypothetical protein
VLLIVAILVPAIAHAPPVVVFDKVVCEPAHTVAVPAIDEGSAFTVTIVVAAQPVDNVYVIATVPAFTPVATPPVVIVAVEVLPLAHVPPVVVLLNEIVEPAHTDVVPVIAAGNAFTVTTFVAAVVPQPVLIAYDIVAVPVVTPVTMPFAEPIVATPALALLHTPPPAVLANVVVLPLHTDAVPVIEPALDVVLTETTAVVVPQLVL